MPVKRPCTYSRCPNYAIEGSSKCAEHHKEYVRKSYDKIERKHDFYNTKYWRTARKRFLRANPFCVECGTPYNVQVDHIKRFGADWELFKDESNWQTLCKTHHDRKTARGE
ncbi:MAG: HNH endonuclease signature motif containing protein [Candidatus Hodarchaeales archaeon]